MQSRNTEWFSPMVMDRLHERIEGIRNFAVKHKKGIAKYQLIFDELDKAEKDLRNINDIVKKDGTYKLDANGNPLIKNRELVFHDQLDDPIISNILNTIKTQALELSITSKNLFKKDDGKILIDSLTALCDEFFNNFHRKSKTNLTIAAYDIFYKHYQNNPPMSPASSTVTHTKTDSVSRSATPPSNNLPTVSNDVDQVETITLELDKKAKVEKDHLTEIENLKVEKQQILSEHKEELQTLRTKQMELELQNQNFLRELSSLRNQAVSMEQTAFSVQGAFDKLENEYRSLQDVSTEIKKQNDTLKNQYLSAQTKQQIAEKNSELATSAKRTLEEQIQTLQTQVTDLQDKVSSDDTAFKQMHQSLDDLKNRSTFTTAQRVGIAIGVIVGLGLLATGIGAVIGIGILAAIGAYAGLAAIVAGGISLGVSLAKGETLANNQQQSEVTSIDSMIPKNRIVSIPVLQEEKPTTTSSQVVLPEAKYSPRHFQPAPTEANEHVVELQKNNTPKSRK